MKKSTIGVIIAAVIMIVTGGGLFVGGMMAAGGVDAARDMVSGKVSNGVYDLNWDEDEFNIDFKTENEEKAKKSGTAASEKQTYSAVEPVVFGMEDVKSLHLEVDDADVEIESTTNGEFSVRTDGNYEIYVKNGVLHIKSRGFQDTHKMLIEIPTLQVPGEILFEEVEIHAGASNIHMSQISSKEFDLEVGAGRVEIGELTANHAEFDVGAGEIIVAYGNLFECETNVDMGNFEYTGMVSKHGDVECNMGNAEFQLEQELEAYNYEIECGAGNVDIGDQSFSGLGRENHINHHAQESFEIECNMGNVSINSLN